MNERRDEFNQDSLVETRSIASDRRSIGSVGSTTGASSYESAVQDHETSSVTKSPQFSQATYQENQSMSNEPIDALPTKTDTSGAGLGRSQSLSDSSRLSNTRRRDKAAVGFACQNCKKAHLACDVSRPCRRCVQMGRSSTCTDVPHKRRGRPRLRDMQQQLSTIASPGQASPPRPIMPSSPVLLRRGPTHIRTGSMTSPYTEQMSPSTISNPWTRSPLQQSRRQLQPMNIHTHSRQVSVVPESLLSMPQSSMAYQGSQTAEPYRAASATLFVSTDLIIVRALQDVQNFFYAEPAVIEGRNVAELVVPEDRARMPQLIRALQEDVHANRLLFSAQQHRQSLHTDLLPYSNADLSHPFPGATEHLLGLTFIDALNRPITSRMVAVLGSRSNDRFAYVIVSIQRHDHVLTPPTPINSMPSSSPRNYDAIPHGMASPEFEFRQAAMPSAVQQRSPTFPSRQMQSNPVSLSNTLPRSIPQGYVAPSIPNFGRSTGTTGLGLNVLPPLQTVAVPEPPQMRMTGSTQSLPQSQVQVTSRIQPIQQYQQIGQQQQPPPPPPQQQRQEQQQQLEQQRLGTEQTVRRADEMDTKSSKRTSMSLSEMID